MGNLTRNGTMLLVCGLNAFSSHIETRQSTSGCGSRKQGVENGSWPVAISDGVSYMSQLFGSAIFISEKPLWKARI
jgi:hypothetical protein